MGLLICSIWVGWRGAGNCGLLVWILVCDYGLIYFVFGDWVWLVGFSYDGFVDMGFVVGWLAALGGVWCDLRLFWADSFVVCLV